MFSNNVNILKLNGPCYPSSLSNILHPPKQLYYIGAEPIEWDDKPKVAIVGSRKMSAYGKAVTQRITKKLSGYGVVIISGLAYGIDVTAHQSALDNQGLTVAVLPTSLKQIYPSVHLSIADRIVKSGGTIMTEYPEQMVNFKTNFIARNRIVSGLADVLLITEAAINSGSLHTARFALDQGKTVMAVPGNINSPGSEGCNNLIKSGAVPVTTAEDVLFALKIDYDKKDLINIFRGSKSEEKILEYVTKGVSSQEELAILSKMDLAEVISTLTSLEIAGAIRPYGGGQWTKA